MASLPIVSIVINNYNYARFLSDAIQSALQQTYGPAEVIVVDDGSTDQSLEIIRGFGDAIKPLFKSNGGQASSLSAGYNLAGGDIVIFLDADDMLSPDAADGVVKAFLANPEVGKIQYRMEVIDAAGQHSGILKPALRMHMLTGDIRKEIISFPFDIPWLPTSGNAFSRRVLREIMPIPDSYGPVGADWYLTQTAALFGPVEFIDRVLAYYRVHGANSYERGEEGLDLDQLRRSILYAAKTIEALKEYAMRLGLLAPQQDILSVSYIANRIISYKMEPRLHPISGDTASHLCGLGIKAASRRSDMSLAIRIAFSVWFVAMMIVPGSIGKWLALQFLYPGRRMRLNSILDRL